MKFNANHVSARRTSPVTSSSSKAGLLFYRLIFKEGLVRILCWWLSSCVFGCSFSAHDNKMSYIVPHHVTLAIKNDGELNKLLGDIMIAAGGVLLKFTLFYYLRR
jgi:hypothetical protein